MRGIGLLVDELCAALVAFDPACWSGADCADLAEWLARAAKACESASVRAAARAADCGSHRTRGDASAAEWLARVSGSSAGAARAALGTVGQLSACPDTCAAVAAGEVSLAQAAQITSMPEHEAELLCVARECDPHHFEKTERDRKAGLLVGTKKERGP